MPLQAITTCNGFEFTTLPLAKIVTVTDVLSFADNPVFGGTDYLYFTASINTGPAVVGLDMSSQERPIRKGNYALVLAAEAKSPMAPRTGDEADKKEPLKDAASKVKPTKIDFDGLMNRVVALPNHESLHERLVRVAVASLWGPQSYQCLARAPL